MLSDKVSDDHADRSTDSSNAMSKYVGLPQTISNEVSSIVKVNRDIALILIKCGNVSIMRNQSARMAQFIALGAAENGSYLQL